MWFEPNLNQSPVHFKTSASDLVQLYLELSWTEHVNICQGCYSISTYDMPILVLFSNNSTKTLTLTVSRDRTTGADVIACNPMVSPDVIANPRRSLRREAIC